MRTFLVALRALVYTIAAVLLFGWIVLSVRTFDRSFGVLFPAWTEIPGIILTVVGGILVLICFGIFVARGRGTPLVLDPPKEFVTLGPYKYVRNPIHIGQVTLFIGLGLYLRSVSVLFFALVWLVLVDLYVVYFEEPNLKNKFGATYQDYCKAVPRWIPRW